MTPYPKNLDYGVTRDGRIFRIRKARFGRPVPYELKAYTGTTGYPMVGITIDGVAKSLKVHRIVAETFIPNPEGKPEVAHGDGTRWNNNVDNLRWVSRKENMEDARGHGTLVKDERCAGVLLNTDKAANIRRRALSGERGRDLAAEYGVSEQIICDIKKGRRWAHVCA